ncbi:MAG: trehalose 6-phosphate phosphatase [Frankiales bacterium]|nr:trehalose 6-phosphate phosphatase [Frankiales bacterium]
MATALPQSRTPEGAAGLAALLADPAHGVVALDFDGTLAPIVDRPEDSRPAPGAVEALAAISAQVAAVAIITGRAAATAVALGGFDRAAGLDRLVVLGQYGAERWEAATGEMVPATPAPGLERARTELAGLVGAPQVPAGVEVEDKGVALGVHLRRTADPAAAAAALRPALEDLAARTGLVVEPGRMVLELRAPGVDKGSALRRFVHEQGGRSVLFAGDDLGDLAAFEAVRGLRAEGISGVTVCSASDEVSELSRVADLVVDGPAGVVALLVQVTELIQGNEAGRPSR